MLQRRMLLIGLHINADRRKAAAKARYDAAATKPAYNSNLEKMKALFRDCHASCLTNFIVGLRMKESS